MSKKKNFATKNGTDGFTAEYHKHGRKKYRQSHTALSKSRGEKSPACSAMQYERHLNQTTWLPTLQMQAERKPQAEVPAKGS